jgi:tetratricopeptide (TPR) repeat protein
MVKLIAILALALAAATAESMAPEYTPDGRLMRPTNYREWIFLSSGLGMTYGAGSNADANFDNVFVSPPAYREFLRTGKWPDKTMFVLEVRAASSHGSINKAGHFQSELASVQAEVKDEKRFPEKWAYFSFGGTPGNPGDSARAIPKGSACHTCHGQNGAVENTFVQFYPTLLPVAQAKQTLKASYEPPVPSPVKFFEIVSERGWPAAAKVFEQAKAKDPDAPLFKESSLNRLGSQLMMAGKTPEAVAVLEMTVASYPKSAAAYDTLAEAYSTAGQKEKALAASKKVLDLLAADDSLGEERRKSLRKNTESRLAKLKGAS